MTLQTLRILGVVAQDAELDVVPDSFDRSLRPVLKRHAKPHKGCSYTFVV